MFGAVDMRFATKEVEFKHLTTPLKTKECVLRLTYDERSIARRRIEKFPL